MKQGPLRAIAAALMALSACSGEASRERREVSTSPSDDVCKDIAQRSGMSNFSVTECEKSIYVSQCKDGAIVYSSKDQNCSIEQGWATDLKIPDG